MSARISSAGPVRELFSPEAALDVDLRRCAPLASEVVELSAALGRVCSETVTSGRSMPPWDSSAMDGYAVRAAEVKPVSRCP